MNICDLKGLGPKSSAELLTIGISTVDEFKQADAFEMYRLLKEHNSNTSLNMLYALVGAQENINWQDIAKERKVEILMRLDDMGLAPK
ncbi:MAG: transcriptional regulator [endosymbiont of Galathealinum brachiosum]|uniref:Transcriptional regulator n=1 Tax=endosymbiont of Galathealinum brachiosum TaxID=2200906 RepID=A0A370DA80_9GAMM|nr:MAG: transcriptional regulator [endosymbiont of Galathealinum brachiosum]